MKTPAATPCKQPAPAPADITAQDIEAWIRVERALAGKDIDMLDSMESGGLARVRH